MGILDFGFWVLGIEILDFGDFGFWILGSLDFGFWGRNPKSKIQNPKSPIQTFLAKFSGFWILDFGSLCSNSLCEAATPHILDFGGDFEFWILEVGEGIQDFGDFGFWILDVGDFGCWILDFGDFGFWIFGILGILDFGFLEHFGTLCSRSLCAKFGFWNLGILDFGDFGFWILGILDFGFWILGILDFGFWTGDFGLASCDKILDAT